MNDYVVGVDAGLDSHGRKDRGGHQMEHLVEAFIKKSGVTYSREIETQELSKQFGIILPESFAKNKRWDFAVKTPGHVYAIATFSVLDTLFNIADMEHGVFSQIFSA